MAETREEIPSISSHPRMPVICYSKLRHLLFYDRYTVTVQWIDTGIMRETMPKE
jgi:hypothetical protein